MIMKGFLQWSAVQSYAEFRLQQDSNRESRDPKSGALGHLVASLI